MTTQKITEAPQATTSGNCDRGDCYWLITGTLGEEEAVESEAVTHTETTGHRTTVQTMAISRSRIRKVEDDAPDPAGA